MTVIKPTSSTAVTRRSLQDEVYDAVLDMLVDGEVESGAALGIDALAARLQVSPTPVREALARLESTNLVTRTAMRGYRVAEPMSPTQVQELFDARVMVEVEAARMAYDRRSTMIPRLEEVCEVHGRHVGPFEEQLHQPHSPERSAVLRAYFEADWQFHRVIVRSAGNRYLERMLDMLGTSSLRLRQIALTGSSDASTALHEHGVILEAFRAGTLPDVVGAVTAHVDAVRSRSVHDAEPEAAPERRPA